MKQLWLLKDLFPPNRYNMNYVKKCIILQKKHLFSYHTWNPVHTWDTAIYEQEYDLFFPLARVVVRNVYSGVIIFVVTRVRGCETRKRWYTAKDDDRAR